jgi:hypothetical protein
MQRTLTLLGGLLVAQLILAGALQFVGEDGGPKAQGSGEPLASFKKDGVETIEITNGEGQTVRIERSDGDWKLPDSAGFPAPTGDVDQLLEALSGFEERLPTARTESARERFSVAEDGYERRVKLMGADGPVATVYFGQSAGPDRVYARGEGARTIYEVGFALRKAKATTTAWLDESVARVKLAEAMEVRLPGYRVRRGNDGNRWLVLADGGQVEPAVPSQAAQLMQRLVQPELQDVARVEPPDADAKLAYTVAQRDGTKLRFSYYPSDEGDGVYLHRDDQPWRYTVASKQLKQILQQGPDKLTTKKKPASNKQGGQGGGS